MGFPVLFIVYTNRAPPLKSFFDILLKLPEVTEFGRLVVLFADARTEISGGEGYAGFRYSTVESTMLGGQR